MFGGNAKNQFFLNSIFSSTTRDLKKMIPNHNSQFVCSPFPQNKSNARNELLLLRQIFSFFSNNFYLFSANSYVHKRSATNLVALDRLVVSSKKIAALHAAYTSIFRGASRRDCFYLFLELSDTFEHMFFEK